MAEEGGGLRWEVDRNAKTYQHSSKTSTSEYASSPHHSPDSPTECDPASVSGWIGDDAPSIPRSPMTQPSAEVRTVQSVPIGDGSTLNSTRSLYDTDITYVTEHGRRYCGEYFMPIDEEECDRMRIVHQLYLYLFDKELTTVPLHRPSKILDIGTGCGDWAIEMGDTYPEAEIIGTDIAKIQPSAVPLNVFFEIDDAEEEDGWTWPEDEFDLVHFRNMAGAFRSWTHLYEEAFTHLKPGGWVEVNDFDVQDVIFDVLGQDSAVKRFVDSMHRASEISDRPKSTKHLDTQLLIDLGFEEVQVKEYAIPLGGWPGLKTERNMEKLWLLAVTESFEAFGLRDLTQHLGRSAESVRESIKAAQDELQAAAKDPERARGLRYIIKVLAGRKPGASECYGQDAEMTTANNSESDSQIDEADRAANTPN